MINTKTMMVVECAVCKSRFWDEVHPDEINEEHYCSRACHMADSHEAMDGTLDLIHEEY